MKTRLLFMLFLSGCTTPMRPVEPPKTDPYVVHRVSQPGETLAMISKWYTGAATNWKEILHHNEGLDVRRMKLGQRIKIPAGMVKRTQPFAGNDLPNSGLGSSTQKVVRAAAPSSGALKSAATNNSDRSPTPWENKRVTRVVSSQGAVMSGGGAVDIVNAPVSPRGAGAIAPSQKEAAVTQEESTGTTEGARVNQKDLMNRLFGE